MFALQVHNGKWWQSADETYDSHHKAVDHALLLGEDEAVRVVDDQRNVVWINSLGLSLQRAGERADAEAAGSPESDEFWEKVEREYGKDHK